MGRAPCCDKTKVKRGAWSPEEDTALRKYIEKYGTSGNWIALPNKAGLKRCGKSCRLRWLNYLRPDIKHGGFTDEEDNIILTLYTNIGSRWSIIASHLPGRTDNDVKNYWNSKLKKKLLAAGAKGLEGVVNASNPTTIVPINNSNSNSFTANSSDFSSATSFNELQQNFCGNSICPSMDRVIQGYPAGVIPDTLYESTSTNQFTLPGLLDFQENGTPQNGLTTSSSQEILSLSPSYSFAKSYASWNDNVVTDEVGFFMELESKLSDFDLLQNAQQEVDISTEVDGSSSSLVNYCDPTECSLWQTFSDNIVLPRAPSKSFSCL